MTAEAKPRTERRRRWFLAIYPVYLAALVWLGVQGYWFFAETKTGQSRTDVWGYYYPKLRPIRDAEILPGDGAFDVLLLGGSVLEQVAPRLEQALRQDSSRPVRVHSVCTSAHTSRDSYLKFTQLEGKAFDLVIVYHGINDVRMNCIPDDLYQSDYTHCAHYRGLEKALEAGSLRISGMIQNRVDEVIGLGEPDAEMLDFGDTIKTPPAFRANVEGILDLADRHSIPVLLVTFAYFVPEDYSKERFSEKTLAYGRGGHELPIEVWGKKDNVVRGIELHNREIRDLAERRPVMIFDQANALPKDGRHFSDICHLTDLGIQRFVENLLPMVRDLPGEQNQRARIKTETGCE